MLKKRMRFLLLSLLMIGVCSCSKTPENIQTDTQEETKADRYQEIIDTTGSADEFSMFFMDLPEVNSNEERSGDSTLIKFPNGEVMLIDAGQYECAPVILQLLKDLGIERIDYFLATHPHIDHIGGFKGLVDNIEIGMVYRSNVEYTTDTYHDFVATIADHGIKVEYLKEGDTVDFGEVQMKIYNPPSEIEYPKDFPDNSTQFINNNSITAKFTYGDSTALFCGDLYVSRERDLVGTYGEELRADVIKANHHGKDTSNSNKWIKNVQAMYVVAMNDEVDGMKPYDNYNKAGTAYFHTFLNGFVKISMDKEKNYTTICQYDNWNNTNTD